MEKRWQLRQMHQAFGVPIFRASWNRQTFPEIWTRSKHKMSSRCSTDKLVRAPFLNHCALNIDESRGKFTVSLFDDHFPRADA